MKRFVFLDAELGTTQPPFCVPFWWGLRCPVYLLTHTPGAKIWIGLVR
jgi:hypothetical protein